MRRLVVLVTLVLTLGAGPASASTTVVWGVRTFPPIYASYMREISVTGDDGANHDIVVKPSGAQQFGGFPQKVEIYDYGDTFAQPAPDPSGDRHGCIIDSPHHVTCAASGPPTVPGDPYSYLSYAEIWVGTGDGNDSLEVSDPLNPMVVGFSTAAGNDHVEISGMWSRGLGLYGGTDSLGTGDDYAHIGAAPFWLVPYAGQAGGQPAGIASGRYLSGDAGNDTIDTLNASTDHISCGDGIDSWNSDPLDDQSTGTQGGYGPPDTNGDCESRTPQLSP